MTPTLEHTVIEIVAKQSRREAETVTLDTTFEELGLGSLAAIELLFALEEKFSLVVPDDAAQDMKSVRDIVDGLRSLGITKPPESG